MEVSKRVAPTSASAGVDIGDCHDSSEHGAGVGNHQPLSCFRHLMGGIFARSTGLEFEDSWRESTGAQLLSRALWPRDTLE